MATPDAPPPLEFYFEFASPFAYFASLEVERVARRQRLELVWRPMMLGGIMKHTGMRPGLTDGMRGQYLLMDCRRWAERHAIPFLVEDPNPMNSLKAARGCLHFRETPHHVPYIHACFAAYWARGTDLFDDGVMAGIVEELGADVDAYFAAIADPELKARLIAETEAARLRGVFGAPTFFFGDEMMWGNDRLPLLEAIIAERTAPPPNSPVVMRIEP